MNEQTPVLLAEHVGFRYPGQSTDALKEVDVTLVKGQAVGLLGPNGSGKSTLIDLLMGLKKPGSGRIVRPKLSQFSMALVPQEYAFYPDLTCVENLRFFAGMLDISSDESARRVDAAITNSMLEEFAEKRANQCSGGVRRKLNLGIALLQKPDILLLDEPTVGIDPQSRAFILEQVKTLVASGCSVLYATHYMEEVSAVCSNILLLDHGTVLASGNLASLLLHPEGGMPFSNLESLFMHYTKRSLRDSGHIHE